ncbi:50S ribosome-binding GTPase [Paeniclostridium sp. NSJ-45]|uniref:50S ribosome-binding GTPase n=1 Tax=Paeniclostridium hominis TaxID=2764329 RepID=A0ABR7K0X6_9FIRM|nr:50S ribosome-binding GTPase [Paeniclostridium hominis]
MDSEIKKALDISYKQNIKFIEDFSSIINKIESLFKYTESDVKKLKKNYEDNNNKELKERSKIKDQIDEFTNMIYKLKNNFQTDITSIKGAKEENIQYFTISFFGITNAGKSTIIETFTNSNRGNSIGTGKQNTTKVVTSSNFGRLRILDTPGFEGGEEFEILAKEEIKKTDLAIFVCANKPPEISEVEKIAEWVKENNLPFILVINQKSAPPNITNIKDFKPTQKIIDYAENILKNDLKLKNFKIVAINAQLAFFGKNNDIDESREDLHKSKSSSLKKFKNLENILEYSNFKELEYNINAIIKNECNILKTKNIYESLSIYLYNVIIESNKNKNSFYESKEFLKKRLKSIKYEFGETREYGKKGEEVRYIIQSNLGCVQSLKNEGIKIIDRAFANNSKEIDTELKELFNEFNFKISKDIIPKISKEVEERLRNQLDEFEKSMELELKGFINVEDITELIKNALEEFKNNKFKSNLIFAFETIATIIEGIAVRVNVFLGFAIAVAKTFLSKLLGKSRDTTTENNMKRNQKRKEAIELLTKKCNSIEKEIQRKLWNGYKDKNKNEVLTGFKDILDNIRNQIANPLEEMYKSSENGSVILKKFCTEMSDIKFEVDRKLYQEVIDLISDKSIKVNSVIRKPGRYAIVGCKSEEDIKNLENMRCRIDHILQDEYTYFILDNDDKEVYIKNIIENATQKLVTVNTISIDDERDVLKIYINKSYNYSQVNLDEIKIALQIKYNYNIELGV